MPGMLGGERDGGLVRTLDPRARILAVMVFAVVVVGVHGFAALGLALAVSFGLMLLARLPPARTLRRMAAMDGFIVFMLLLLPFTVPGEAVFTVAGHGASREGMVQAARIALKANAVVLALMALVGSMESVTLGHALHRLGVPANLAHLLLFTVRYIEVIHQEYLRLRIAMKTRGFQPANSRHTYRSFGYLIGMMLVRALERSERILQAMQCRGFSGVMPLLDSFRFGRRDIAFALVMTGVVVTLIVLELSRAVLA